MLKDEENLENYAKILEDYEKAVNIRTERIEKLYTEINLLNSIIHIIAI